MRILELLWLMLRRPLRQPERLRPRQEELLLNQHVMLLLIQILLLRPLPLKRPWQQRKLIRELLPQIREQQMLRKRLLVRMRMWPDQRMLRPKPRLMRMLLGRKRQRQRRQQRLLELLRKKPMRRRLLLELMLLLREPMLL